jgi:hypothetical protein
MLNIIETLSIHYQDIHVIDNVMFVMICHGLSYINYTSIMIGKYNTQKEIETRLLGDIFEMIND